LEESCPKETNPNPATEEQERLMPRNNGKARRAERQRTAKERKLANDKAQQMLMLIFLQKQGELSATQD